MAAETLPFISPYANLLDWIHLSWNNFLLCMSLISIPLFRAHKVMHVVACSDILACLASKQSLQPYAWVEAVQQFTVMYHTILSQPLAVFMHTLLRLASDSFEDWKLYPLILEANCIVPEASKEVVCVSVIKQKLFSSQSACSQNRLVHRLKCGRCLLCQC